MTTIAVNDPHAAASYLESVSLPRMPTYLESAGSEEAAAPVDYRSGEEQALAVGSQIAEFAADVPADIRPQIANAFLLAQLAANRKIEGTEGGTKEWYDQYVEVLANIGWLVESDQASERDVSGDTAEVHKEIIPVLTAALGPAVAATTIVVSALKGLADMDKNKPWITLFDRESQRASANQFQISYAAVDDSKKPRISLVCFELDALRSRTQVLFFKFSSAEAKLRHFGAELSINPSVFEQVQDVVEERIAEYVSSYVADIEI